jgi:type IV pilus assembly protein PilW
MNKTHIRSRGVRVIGRRRQAGLSLIELMISITIGLVILTAIALVFVNASSTRTELERVGRQIENGRYAIDLLSNDLRMAGFYGELDVAQIAGTALPSNPCSLSAADWNAAIPVHVQGYDDAGFASADCALSNQRPNTDVLIVRRTRACVAGSTDCGTVAAGRPYLQVSLCATDPGTERHELGIQGTAAFPYHKKDCVAAADKRLYYVHIYYVSNDNGAGQAIPTLRRLELSYSGGLTWADMPLVEGIEEFNIEYGIDQDGDGAPDAYTADPNDFPVGGCAGNCPLNNWMNTVTARIFLLARNLEPSQDYTDSKTYSLGNDKNGVEVTVTPGGNFRRHVYSGLVRIANVSNRRDTP